MKKNYVLVLLTVMLFLVTTSLPAVNLEFTNIVGDLSYNTLETKTTTLEVAGTMAGIDIPIVLAPPSEISGDLPFPGTEQGYIGEMVDIYRTVMDSEQITAPNLFMVKRRKYKLLCGGDCFGGSITARYKNSLMAA